MDDGDDDITDGGASPMSDDDISDDDGASPTMSDDEEQPVLAEAAESGTEPSLYDVVQQFLHVLTRLRGPRFSASSMLLLVPRDAAAATRYIFLTRGILREGVFRWYDADGVPVEDGAYRDGGFGGVPAMDEAIADLPETTVGEGEEKAECAVCLEAYEAGDMLRTMPCSHGFHERCILPWLRVSRLCPLCRFALPAAAGVTESDTWEHDGDVHGEEESTSSMDQID